MKRKIETLRYLLWAMLFFAVAYLLCGVITGLPFRGAVHFQNMRVFAVTLLVGLLSIVVINAFIFAIPDALPDALHEGWAPVYLLFILGMCIVPSGVCGAIFLETFDNKAELMNNVAGASMWLTPWFELVTFYMMKDADYDAFFDVNGVKMFCLSATLAVALSGVLSLVYMYVSLVQLVGTTSAEFLSLIDLAAVERLNGVAALGGLALFAVLARRDSE